MLLGASAFVMSSSTRDRSNRSTRLLNGNRPATLAKTHNSLKLTGGNKKLQNVNRERTSSKENNLKNEQIVKKDQVITEQQKQLQELSKTKQTVRRICKPTRQGQIPTVQTPLPITKSKLGLEKYQNVQKLSTIQNNQKKDNIRRVSLLKQHIDEATRALKSRPSVKPEETKLSIGLERTGIKERFKELVDIPPKEFEKNFREWMEQDDVARALQAKLRADLINEFHKTALGKQILSVNTSSFVGVSNSGQVGGAPVLSVFGKLPKPLTLQSLPLVLHTLVAEFLHAENCHFSLSVFCTEVPYSHALPDFETRNNFRFLENEIELIMEAVTNSSSEDSRFLELRKNVKNTYLETRHSFLYALIKKLVEIIQQQQQQRPMCTVGTATTIDRIVEPVQCKATTSVGTLTKSCVQSTVGTMTAIRKTSTKGTSTMPINASPLLKPKCHSKLTQTETSSMPPMRQQKCKSTLCHKATNTERKSVTDNIAMQTGEPELQQLLNGHLITLLRRVRELVVLCELSIKPHKTDGQLNLNRMCQNLEKHTMELTQMRGSVAHCSLEKLQEIFMNLRLSTQSLKQVMILRSQASLSTRSATPTNKTKLTTKKTILLLDTATQTESQQPPLSAKIEEKRARHTADAGQQTEPSKQTVGTNTTLERPVVKHSVATNTAIREKRTVEQQTLKPPDKTYEEWVHEMTNTPSGQVFLDRVEASLRKALFRQKNKMYKLYDIKLRHHRELLRMRYKRPSVEQICQNAACNTNGDARQLMDALGKQFCEFESRQQIILDKIKAADIAKQNAMSNQQSKLEALSQSEIPIKADKHVGAGVAEKDATAVEANVTLRTPPIELHQELKSQAAKLKRLALVLRDHLPKTQAVVSPRCQATDSKAEPENRMAQAVAEAKARMQQIEDESSQLENKFLSYIERMRYEKAVEFEGTRLKDTDCTEERQCLQDTMRHFKELARQHDQRISNLDRIETNYDLELEQMANECAQKHINEQYMVNAAAVETKDTPDVVFKNAISEAKRKLFDESPWLRERPIKRPPNSDQLEPIPETIEAINEEDVKLSMLTEMMVVDDSHKGGGDGIAVCGAEQMLRNFKAQSTPEEPAIFVPAMHCNEAMPTSATAFNGRRHSTSKLKRYMEKANLHSLTAYLDTQSSDDDNSKNRRKRLQRNDSKIDSDNGRKLLQEDTTAVGFDLRLSSSSTSSSSCSSLEEAFDEVFKKHSLTQTGGDNKDLLTTTTPKQYMKTTPTLPPSSRDKLQRTFAKMEMLFAPQVMLDDESQPSELDAEALKADAAAERSFCMEIDSDSDVDSSSGGNNSSSSGGGGGGGNNRASKDDKFWSKMQKMLH